MGTQLIARHTDLIEPSATFSVAAGSIDSLYPVINAQSPYPWEMARFTGTSGTIRATFGGAQNLQAIGFINTDATAIQLTNNNGLNVAISIPAIPLDGRKKDPWIDLRVIGSSASQWNVALTGPTGVGIGRIALALNVRELEFLLATPKRKHTHPVIRHVTDGHVSWRYGRALRVRQWAGVIGRPTYEAEALDLEDANQGSRYGSLLIPDIDVNDAWLVELTSTTEVEYGDGGIGIQMDFQELQKGIL